MFTYIYIYIYMHTYETSHYPWTCLGHFKWVGIKVYDVPDRVGIWNSVEGRLACSFGLDLRLSCAASRYSVIYIYIYIHTHIYLYIYIYIYMYLDIHLSLYEYLYIYIYIHIAYTYTYKYIDVHTFGVVDHRSPV